MITQVRLISDIHLEFNPTFTFPKTEDEENTTLVLAGDIISANSTKSKKFISFIEEVSERFNSVIYIPGNHEYYNGVVNNTFALIKEQFQHLGNVYCVDNEVVSIDEVDFICGTLWTDFDRNNPISKLNASQMMNDYNIIAIQEDNPIGKIRRFTPDDAYAIHQKSVEFIFDSIKKAKDNNKIPFVVTHHAPSYKSIALQYVNDKVNGAYASDLSERIIACPPKFWVHGHIHDSMDYFVGDCNVVANPWGYYGRNIKCDLSLELFIY
jgi:Icc-related predicted phosphoesterase